MKKRYSRILSTYKLFLYMNRNRANCHHTGVLTLEANKPLKEYIQSKATRGGFSQQSLRFTRSTM